MKEYYTNNKSAFFIKAKKAILKAPEKRRATLAVNNAVARGLLKKMPCMFCGEKKVQGHHFDYSRQLDVIWVCIVHHKMIHQLLNTQQFTGFIRRTRTEAQMELVEMIPDYLYETDGVPIGKQLKASLRDKINQGKI